MGSAGELIRKFQQADTPAVEHCLAELQDFSKLIYPRMADGKTVAVKYLRHLLDRCSEWNGQIFVAEIAGSVVGMACVYSAVEAREPDEQQYEYAYVSDLVVLPDYRGRGLGRALLRTAEDYAMACGATLFRINVLAKNDVARRLYFDVGFEEHLVVLQKPLR